MKARAARPLGSVVSSCEITWSVPPRQSGEMVVMKKGRWFPLKDRGYMDEEGYFYIEGRSDDKEPLRAPRGRYTSVTPSAVTDSTR